MLCWSVSTCAASSSDSYSPYRVLLSPCMYMVSSCGCWSKLQLQVAMRSHFRQSFCTTQCQSVCCGIAHIVDSTGAFLPYASRFAFGPWKRRSEGGRFRQTILPIPCALSRLCAVEYMRFPNLCAYRVGVLNKFVRLSRLHKTVNLCCWSGAQFMGEAARR